MALQPQQPSAEMVCSQMWCRPSSHAQPRVGMTRSRSDLASAFPPASDVTAEGGAAPSASVGASKKGTPASRTVSEGQRRPLPGAPMRRCVSELDPAARARVGSGLPSPAADAAPALAAGGGTVPTPSPLASPLSTPLALANGGGGSFGYPYVKGAICVEPPKRQRTVVSVVQSPRAPHHAGPPHA